MSRSQNRFESRNAFCMVKLLSTSEQEFERWVKDVSPTMSVHYNAISSPGSARSCGVVILFKSEYILQSVFRDEQGRCVSAHFSIFSTDFQINNIYGQNNKCDGSYFFESLYPVVQPDLPLIVCGDFNTVMDPTKDRRGCNSSSYWSYNCPASLSTLISTLNLVDAWRARHPLASEFTWTRPNGSQASRLDMFLVSKELVPNIRTIDILPFFRSDHHYVYLEVSLPSTLSLGPRDIGNLIHHVFRMTN